MDTRHGDSADNAHIISAVKRAGAPARSPGLCAPAPAIERRAAGRLDSAARREEASHLRDRADHEALAVTARGTDVAAIFTAMLWWDRG